MPEQLQSSENLDGSYDFSLYNCYQFTGQEDNGMTGSFQAPQGVLSDPSRLYHSAIPSTSTQSYYQLPSVAPEYREPEVQTGAYGQWHPVVSPPNYMGQMPGVPTAGTLEQLNPAPVSLFESDSVEAILQHPPPVQPVWPGAWNQPIWHGPTNTPPPIAYQNFQALLNSSPEPLPSLSPSLDPSLSPSLDPSLSPSLDPSLSPSLDPSQSMSHSPPMSLSQSSCMSDSMSHSPPMSLSQSSCMSDSMSHSPPMSLSQSSCMSDSMSHSPPMSLSQSSCMSPCLSSSLSLSPSTQSDGLPEAAQFDPNVALAIPEASPENPGSLKRKREDSEEVPFYTTEELAEFARELKRKRVLGGYTQMDLGLSLGHITGKVLSQTTVCRFEAMQLSHQNMCKLRPILGAWLERLEKCENPEDLKVDRNFIDAKKRKRRTSLEARVRALLENFYSTRPKPNTQEIKDLAAELELTRDVIRVWFCNRRQKKKRCDQQKAQYAAQSLALAAIPTQAYPVPCFSGGPLPGVYMPHPPMSEANDPTLHLN